MNSFSQKNVENIMLNENSTGYGFIKNESVNSRLNKIAPDIYRKIIIEENEPLGNFRDKNAYDKIQVPMIQPSNHTRRIIRPSTYNANFDSLAVHAVHKIDDCDSFLWTVVKFCLYYKYTYRESY